MPKLIVCSTCATTNRIAQGKSSADAKCGSCKAPLFSAHPMDVDSANLSKQIAKSDVPVLVDVWAPWCGPCRVMGPAFEDAAKTLEPDMRLVKLNSDQNQQMSSSMNIRGIPTMLLMHKGRELGRISGAMPSHQIIQWARSQLANQRA